VYVFQLIVEAVHVVLCAAVLVCFLCALEVTFELGEGVRAKTRVEVVVGVVRALELCADIFEISEGEFLGVAAFGNADER